MSWFPLHRSLIEQSLEYRHLTPSEKLYVVFLVSEFNLRGKFYKSDVETGVTLSISEKTVRRARKTLATMGWLDYKPGFGHKPGDKSVATRYLSLTWPRPQERDFFARIHRYSFQVMLNHLMEGRLVHADVVVWLTLSYWFKKYASSTDERSDVFITMAWLKELANLSNPLQNIERILAVERLFKSELVDNKLHISGFLEYSDPANDENNQSHYQRYLEKLNARIGERKAQFYGK